MLHRLLVLLLPLATTGCLLPYAAVPSPNAPITGEAAAYSLTREMWDAVEDSSKRDPNALPERIVGAELLPDGVLVVACEWSDGSTRVHSGAGRIHGSWYAETTFTRDRPPRCEEVQGGVRLPGTSAAPDPEHVQPGDVLSLRANVLRFSSAGGPPVETGALAGAAHEEQPGPTVAMQALGVLGTPFTLCADATMLGVSVVTFAVLLPPALLLEWLD